MSRERETLEVDILFVGGGPASLSGALHLRNLIDSHNRHTASPAQQLGAVSIAVIEKGREIGAHNLSGAILDPIALRELMPAVDIGNIPTVIPVAKEHLWFLTSNRRIQFPWVPAPLNNHANFILSLNRFVRWLGEQADARGIDLFPGFAGTELLLEGNRLVGVRTGARGLDRQGQPKASYEPGVDILAKAIVFGEGVRGSLTKQVISRFQLDAGRNPALYAVGVKEVWEVPEDPSSAGVIIHTLGFPLKSETYGGGFLYHMGRMISLGLVVGLDYRDPFLDPYREFQRFKNHPQIASYLKKRGKVVHYGAKALPEGGYFSIPRSYFNGGILIGDGAELLNAQRLKGIHLAMKSGMMAAETLFQALLKSDFSESALSLYERLLMESWVGHELYRERNFRQGFQHGLWRGLLHSGFQMISGGRGIKARLSNRPGHERMRKIEETPPSTRALGETFQLKEKTTIDKASSVYYSGIRHDEDQPVHLLVADLDICHTRCTREYGNPCQYFCPAQVYELVDGHGSEGKRLQLNPSNCIHCKTCDIMDPYQIITWVPPEGGSGPSFMNL